MAADLTADTRVHRLDVAPGWYTANLPEHWNFLTPSGGVLMTVALRAMREELGDRSLALVSANTLFCSPVPHGPLEIRVEVLRRGRSAAQVRAALSSTALPGPGLEVSATFGRARPGAHHQGASFPDLPLPADAPALDELAPGNPHRGWPFFQNFEIRLAEGERWWRGDWRAGVPRYARWFRYRCPPLDGDRLDPLAWPPIVDTMPAALINALGPGSGRLIAPSLDLTIHFFADSSADWHLVRAFSRRAHGGYASAEAEIWSERRELVAFATQTMILKSLPPARTESP